MSADEKRAPDPDRDRKIIVAIDGPAGAGKSTIARHLARHFGLLNLETGAMYRAFALKALRSAIPVDDAKALEVLTHETEIRLEPGEEENLVLLDGEDVTGLIRNPLVTEAASRVSVFPAVRAWMVRLQQQVGARGGVVMEGRDIGTVVFPNAEVKIFLDAAPEVRGQRRYEQIGQNGFTPAPPPEGGAPGDRSPSLGRQEILRDLRARDERDRNRKDSPLKPASDAVILDSTNMSLKQALAAAETIVAQKLEAAS
ncbi:MAG: (d)CMP kinase [Terracidiphilus sp.]